MALYEFWTSRNNSVANTAAYIGQVGRLFYDNTDGILKISDGVTPGGIRITYPIATTTTVGGIKAGPGANVSTDGTLTINTAGLPLSFGDFTANVNILTLVNNNQNMVLATKGDAEVQLVGNIGFYKPDGLPPNVSNRYFQATDDGQIMISVPAEDLLLGAVEIVGSSTGNVIAPGIVGAMLHVTGQLDIPNRVYFDGNGDYVSLVARRWNGSVASPTQVLAGEDILRINATAASNVGVPNVAVAQMRVTSLENQTSVAQGSSITFTVTPIGQSAANRVDVANITVANGVWASKFTTSGNVSAASITATGTISSTGNLSAGNISTGQLTATGAITSGDGISDSLGQLRSIPQNGKSTNYTLQATDNGQMINITSGNVTIPGGVFNSPYGQTVSIFNNQNFSNTIVQGTNVTLRLAGTASTGNRTLARYGIATVVCVAANTFVISGAGIT